MRELTSGELIQVYGAGTYRPTESTHCGNGGSSKSKSKSKSKSCSKSKSKSKSKSCSHGWS